MEGNSYSKSDHGDDGDLGGGSDTQGGAGGHGDGVKQGKRRTRNDPDSRNFTCGCGKSYLSYAALYTHIKTKHDGIAPSGTSQPNNNGKSGRGRPKKEDSAVKAKDEEKSDDEALDAGRSMQDFLDYLTKLGLTLRYDNQNIKDNENAIMSSGQKTDPVQSFSTEIFGGTYEKDYLAVLENLKILKRAPGNNIFNDEIDQSTELRKTKLNKIFAVFLYQMSQYIKEEFYRELCFFACMYRKSLNEMGWKTKGAVMQRAIESKEANQEFCEVNNGEFAPDICNDFITDSLPEYFKNNYDLKNFKVLGPTTEQTKNAVFFDTIFL